MENVTVMNRNTSIAFAKKGISRRNVHFPARSSLSPAFFYLNKEIMPHRYTCHTLESHLFSLPKSFTPALYCLQFLFPYQSVVMG